jgi:GNAT superfamily N-acetyltransferase
VVVSDGGIASGGEFERSCGMSGRSEDVLDLGSFWQGVEERRTHRVAGRARSVACRSLSRSAGLLSRPVGCPRAVT